MNLLRKAFKVTICNLKTGIDKTWDSKLAFQVWIKMDWQLFMGKVILHGTAAIQTVLYDFYRYWKMEHVCTITWSHLRSLLRVTNAEAREWYLKETVSQGWRVRTLDRNISSQYYEQLLEILCSGWSWRQRSEKYVREQPYISNHHLIRALHQIARDNTCLVLAWQWNVKKAWFCLSIHVEKQVLSICRPRKIPFDKSSMLFPASGITSRNILSYWNNLTWAATESNTATSGISCYKKNGINTSFMGIAQLRGSSFDVLIIASCFLGTFTMSVNKMYRIW